ncbi:MAG: zinc ribbon domain-containing protein [Candidatus Heimdallarchaeota archaeon]|nr:MAG: zinc ribbon domain-containing protein [Candidatus Heimdallarchaeota archaeon]
MVKCWDCGKEVEEGSKHRHLCLECGQKVEEERMDVYKEEGVCVICGESCRSGDYYCLKCRPYPPTVSRPVHSSSNSSSPSSQEKTGMICAGCGIKYGSNYSYCMNCGKKLSKGISTGNRKIIHRKGSLSSFSWLKKKKCSYPLLLIVGLCVFTLVTQSFLIYLTQKKPWHKTYGGEGVDTCLALIQTTDGGYAMAGVTNSSGAGGSDMWLVKTDVNGVVQWNETYGGAGVDMCLSLVQTTEGGYALAGVTNSTGAGGNDMWLVKTDVNGVVEWNETYGGAGVDTCLSLIQTTEGSYALAGVTNSFGAGGSDMWLVKTDTNGIVEWNQTYGGIETDGAHILLQTIDRGFALAGSTNSSGSGEHVVWLVKTDNKGVMQWNRTYEGAGDLGVSALQTENGDYVLMCHNLTEVAFYGLINFTLNLYCIKMIKTDVNGIFLLNQTYFISYPFFIHGAPVIQTMDGGFAFSGVGFIEDFESIKTVLVKTDVDGNLKWFRTYKDYNDSETKICMVSSLLQTTNKDFILAGCVFTLSDDDFSLLSSDIWLGTVVWNVDQISGMEILPFLIAICVITRVFPKDSQIKKS